MEKDDSAEGGSDKGAVVVRAELCAYWESECNEAADPADKEERGDDALAIDGRESRNDVRAATAFLSTSAHVRRWRPRGLQTGVVTLRVRWDLSRVRQSGCASRSR